MHPQFTQLMKDATALTRAGDLRAAMASISTALARRPEPEASADDANVVDVEVRIVEGEAAAPVAAVHTAEQFVSGHFSHRAGARDYRLFIPAPQADKPRALVVMLHGCTQNPADFAMGTRMNALGAQYNALVLYPAQTHQANAQGCWNWFKHNHQGRERGEPALLAAMTKHIAETHGVDPARIYVAGLSAGGAMAAILAATHPDVFAAAGVHSGLPAGAARDLPGALAAMKGQVSPAAGKPRSAVRMIVFHGDADATVHVRNADGVASTHGAAAVGAGESDKLIRSGRTSTRRLLKDAQGRVVTEQWTVHGAGHAWSGGDPAGSYADARGPDASAEMMRFFFS